VDEIKLTPHFSRSPKNKTKNKRSPWRSFLVDAQRQMKLSSRRTFLSHQKL
jgi:hypothetical protein